MSLLDGKYSLADRPCSRHRRSSSRLWNDSEDTCGLPHRSAPSSISSSNLIQRAFSCHAHSWLSPSRNSSSSTNICNPKKNIEKTHSMVLSIPHATYLTMQKSYLLINMFIKFSPWMPVYNDVYITNKPITEAKQTYNYSIQSLKTACFVGHAILHFPHIHHLFTSDSNIYAM